MKNKKFKKPKKILLIRTDRLGDVILSTPAIKNLRNFYPDAHIAFATRPYTKEILEGNPYLDEIILYDKDKKHKSIISSIKFCLELRKKKFDVVFILNPTVRANLLTFFATIPIRIGLNRKIGALLNHPIQDTKGEGKKHELEYTLDILKAAGIRITTKDIYFPIKENSELKIKKLLTQYGLENHNFAVLHPSASCPSKIWPQENFIKLAKLLRERMNLKIVIISAEKEKTVSEKLANEKGVIDFRGILTISDIASLLKQAKIFISNDSGPVHIAASVNAPVISIIGRSKPGLSPNRWKPLGEKSFYVHRENFCQECLAHQCQKGFLCLKSITPEEVFELADTVIGS